MDEREIGRRIVAAAKEHSLTVTVKGGKTEARVMCNGQPVFGPASVEECDDYMHALIGRIALEAVTKL